MNTEIRCRPLYELIYPMTVLAVMARRPIENQHFVMAPLPPGGDEKKGPAAAGARAEETGSRVEETGGRP